RDLEAAYRSFDVLLAPTAPTTAFELGAKTADPLSMYLSDVGTIPSNLAGHPALSVPFGSGRDRDVPGGRLARGSGPRPPPAPRCQESRCRRRQGGCPVTPLTPVTTG